MKSDTLAPACLALLIACGTSAAQPVYRCGNLYSHAPCTAQAVPVRTDDARSQAQRAAALQGAARDKALADAMEAARHRDEAMALAPRPIQAQTKPARRSAKVQEPGVFTTRGPADPNKAKPKAPSKARTSRP